MHLDAVGASDRLSGAGEDQFCNLGYSFDAAAAGGETVFSTGASIRDQPSDDPEDEDGWRMTKKTRPPQGRPWRAREAANEKPNRASSYRALKACPRVP